MNVLVTKSQQCTQELPENKILLIQGLFLLFSNLLVHNCLCVYKKVEYENQFDDLYFWLLLYICGWQGYCVTMKIGCPRHYGNLNLFWSNFKTKQNLKWPEIVFTFIHHVLKRPDTYDLKFLSLCLSICQDVCHIYFL